MKMPMRMTASAPREGRIAAGWGRRTEGTQNKAARPAMPCNRKIVMTCLRDDSVGMGVRKEYTRGFVGRDQKIAEIARFCEVYAMRDDAALERNSGRDMAVVPHRGVAHAAFDRAVRTDR